MRSLWLFVLIVIALLGCDDGPAANVDGSVDASIDAAPDVGPVDAAPDVAPAAPQWAPAPPADTPSALQGDTWKTHWIDDIRPYWATPDALGEPLGNYPTYRDMDGGARAPGERRPRMLGRQIYTYAMGYALTGDAELLGWAAAGVDWMLEHARDAENGGWYPLLNAAGDGIGGAKTAQDTAYAVMGLAAWYFVTRDPRAEEALLETRDLLFDAFFDAETGRLVDGLSDDLQRRFDVEGDGGWELVAQLDPINAFMLLVQPVLSEEARRQQFLDDMLGLGDVMVERFWADGIFWGVHDQQGQFRARHVDFGHTLKSYWMLYMLARRAPRADWYALVEEHGVAWLQKAFDAENGRWAKRPIAPDTVEYGSDWWVYAEADQFAASLSMVGRGEGVDLAATAGHWIEDYVDPQPPGGVIPGIGRAGQPAFGWPRSDTAKCNLWKNGYHATEHALVLYLHGRDREGLPATLHFAVPPAAAETFAARPYLYQGTESARRVGDELTVGGRALRAVAVDFVDIY